VPLNLESHFAWQSVLDAIWTLEETLRWLIQNTPHRAGNNGSIRDRPTN
jgi:hypothetical protein